jgi:predicted TIM-barrel fold metal-dependent hydrolase
MIVDADCHISPLKEGSNITVDELLQRMDKAGVDKALVWLTPPYMREIDESNAYVYKSVKAHPDRLLGFGWADPNLGIDKALDSVKRCIEEYGFHGVKLNGAQNDFYIDDPIIAMPVVEAIAETRKLIAFHCGVDAYDKTNPSRIANIASMFPMLKILCVHMGGVGMPDMTRAVIEMTQVHDNVTLVGSMVNHIKVLEAINTLGPHRICFGSDTPFALMHVCVAMYEAMLDGLDEKAVNAVMGQNILKLFGLT